MSTVLLNEIIETLEIWFPLRLAENWDNVGLLIGDRHQPVRKIMTCLTITPEICSEAVDQKASLIVSHHPFPFQPFKQITSETVAGQMMLGLIRAGIAVYSPHTSHDSAMTGINQQIAEKLQLLEISPLYDQTMTNAVADSGLWMEVGGTGRIGHLAKSVKLSELIDKIGLIFSQKIVPFVGDPKRMVQRVAIGCGAAGEFFSQVVLKKADVFLLGEAKYHQFLEAESHRIAMILPGHYATERFAVESLAKRIAGCFHLLDPSCVWASQRETDPLGWHLTGMP
ncbi:MAG: Nif3-like dinuclear metal center hexameric protein [Planctomycetaceae bacterium]|nr:Nif3-like dinuclear metal center hexameric protein [Planctomycetaceae bacterium]